MLVNKRVDIVGGQTQGSGGSMGAPPPDYANATVPQSATGKRAHDYSNDASGWVRGEGETGETKPGFDFNKFPSKTWRK